MYRELVKFRKQKRKKNLQGHFCPFFSNRKTNFLTKSCSMKVTKLNRASAKVIDLLSLRKDWGHSSGNV